MPRPLRTRLKLPRANQRRLIGLYERIAFSAYFLWLSMLAVALRRRRSVAHVGP